MKGGAVMEEREAVRVFKALGDEKRLRILLLLRQGERCACVLLLAHRSSRTCCRRRRGADWC